MSNQAITHVLGFRKNGSWVIEPTKTPNSGSRVVLIALANWADEAGESWPAIETIADASDMSVDQVRRNLQKLVDDGIIERVLHGAPDRRVRADRRTNLYRIVGMSDGSHRPRVDARAGRHDPACMHPRPRVGAANDPAWARADPLDNPDEPEASDHQDLFSFLREKISP